LHKRQEFDALSGGGLGKRSPETMALVAEKRQMFDSLNGSGLGKRADGGRASLSAMRTRLLRRYFLKSMF